MSPSLREDRGHPLESHSMHVKKRVTASFLAHTLTNGHRILLGAHIMVTASFLAHTLTISSSPVLTDQSSTLSANICTRLFMGHMKAKDNCDPSPKPDFHKRYGGIVGSLGYLVTMTRSDLAWSYSELSKYV